MKIAETAVRVRAQRYFCCILLSSVKFKALLRLENRLSQRFLRTMVSPSWCKYIQRDLFPLNNPRFSSGITGAFTYSIWKAVCPLLSSEADRITEKKTEKFNQILLLLQGLSWLLILFKEEEREHSISSVLYKFQHSWTGWFRPGRRHLEALPSACHDMG